MLTLKEFEKLRPGEIFAHGLTSDSPQGINLTGSGETLLWVARKGAVNDFAVYALPVELAEWSAGKAAAHGDKVHDRETIRRLLNCDDDVLARYRD